MTQSEMQASLGLLLSTGMRGQSGDFEEDQGALRPLVLLKLVPIMLVLNRSCEVTQTHEWKVSVPNKPTSFIMCVFIMSHMATLNFESGQTMII